MPALAAVFLLAVTPLAACTAGPRLHPASAAATAPTAVLPTGEGAPERVAAVPAAPGQSGDLLQGDDKRIGPVYNFTAAKEPSSVLISFPVDPARLPALTGVPGATPAGLYIQVYESSLSSWIPLRSAYDPKTRTVSATAPHLSLFGLSWTSIGCAVSCPVKLFAKAAGQFVTDVAASLKKAWSPPQEDDECAQDADPDWTVKSTVEKLTGCVVDPKSAVVRLRNPLLLPMVVSQPPGAPAASLAHQPYMQGGDLEFTSLIAGIIDWAANTTLLAPRGYGVVPVTLPQSGTLSMVTTPDTLGLVMDVIMSVLFLLPGEKSDEEALNGAVEAVLPEFQVMEIQHPGTVTLDQILDAAQQKLEEQKTSSPLPSLTLLEELNDSYECAKAEFSGGAENGGTTGGFLEGAIEFGKSCAKKALEAVGKEEGHSLEAIVELIDAIPNFGKTVREAVQVAELGPSALAGTTTVIGSARLLPAPSYALFAGDWGAHYGYIDIKADGSFTLAERTWTWCSDGPPPCDGMQGNDIIYGYQASGHLTDAVGNVAFGEVTSTNDPDAPEGAITLTLDPGTDILSLSAGGFCGPQAAAGACGA